MGKQDQLPSLILLNPVHSLKSHAKPPFQQKAIYKINREARPGFIPRHKKRAAERSVHQIHDCLPALPPHTARGDRLFVARSRESGTGERDNYLFSGCYPAFL